MASEAAQMRQERDKAREEARLLQRDVEELCAQLSVLQEERQQERQLQQQQQRRRTGHGGGDSERAQLVQLEQDRTQLRGTVEALRSALSQEREGTRKAEEDARSAADDAKRWEERAARCLEDSLRVEVAEREQREAVARADAAEVALRDARVEAADRVKQMEDEAARARASAEEARSDLEHEREWRKEEVLGLKETLKETTSAAEVLGREKQSAIDAMTRSNEQFQEKLALLEKRLVDREARAQADVEETRASLSQSHEKERRQWRKEVDEVAAELELYRENNVTWAERVSAAAREKVAALLELSQMQERMDLMTNQISSQQQQMQELQEQCQQAASDKMAAVMSEANIRIDRDGLQHQQQSLIKELERVSNSSANGMLISNVRDGKPANGGRPDSGRRRSWLQQSLSLLSPSLSASSSVAESPREQMTTFPEDAAKSPLPSSSMSTVAPLSPLTKTRRQSSDDDTVLVGVSDADNRRDGDQDSIKMMASISLQNAKWREEVQTLSNITSSAVRIADSLQDIEERLKSARHDHSLNRQTLSKSDAASPVAQPAKCDVSGGPAAARASSYDDNLVAAEREVHLLGLAVSASNALCDDSPTPMETTSGTASSSVSSMVVHLLRRYVHAVRVAFSIANWDDNNGPISP